MRKLYALPSYPQLIFQYQNEETENRVHLINIFSSSQGSDHCPVYAVLKPIVSTQVSSTGEATESHILDVLNPPGMFIDGTEQSSFRESKAFQVPKLSGRLIPEFTARRSIKDMFSKQAVGGIPAGGAKVDVGDLPTPVEGEAAEAMATVEQTVSRATGEASPSSMSTPTNSSSVEDFASAKIATEGANNRDSVVNSQNSAKRNASSMGVASSTEKRRKALVVVPKSTAGQQKQSRLLGFFKPQEDGGQKITAKTNSAIFPLAKKEEQHVEGNEAQGDSNGGASARVGADVGEGPCTNTPAELTRELHPC